MALAIEDLCNQALRKISYPTPIGYIYEGSRASRIAVEIYSQTRDDLLRSKDWPFARQAAGLTLLKTAPVGGYGVTLWTSAFPPPPWIYEYAYPTGCLYVRSVRPTPIIIPELTPRPNVFVVADDPSLTTPAQVILTNLARAQVVFTGQITNISAMEPMFIEGLIAALALKFQEALSPDANAVKDRATEAQVDVGMADERRG